MSNNMFNIRRISTEEIPPSLLSEGVVCILGRKEALNPYLQQVNSEVLYGIDQSSTIYHYTVKVEEGHDDLADYFECNIMCLLPNKMNGTAEVVIASADPDDLGLAVVAVINEVESGTLDMTETMFALCALGAPHVYHEATNMLIDRLLNKPPHSDSASKGKFGTFIGALGGGIFSTMLLGNIIGAVAGNVARPKKSEDKSLSEKAIREVFERLPEYYADGNKKRNPEVEMILNRALIMYGLEGLVGILLEAAANYGLSLQSIFQTKNDIADKYKLRIRKWSGQEKNMNNYNYCLYLVDNKEEEHLLKFSTTPAYCLYIMYVVDRYMRGEKATDFSLRNNKEQFILLYESLFPSETRETIESYFNTMVCRNDKGKMRNGRYNECITNIHKTLDDMVGFPDSTVLKVGRGNFLSIPQCNIKIDPGLPMIQIA